MAYNKEQVIKLALDILEKKKPTSIAELLMSLPISKSTFYEWKLEESDAIKEGIWKAVTDKKSTMKKQWFKSKNATLQLAWYKLHADPQELAVLSMNKVEHSGEVNHSVSFVEVEYVPTDEE